MKTVRIALERWYDVVEKALRRNFPLYKSRFFLDSRLCWGLLVVFRWAGTYKERDKIDCKTI